MPEGTSEDGIDFFTIGGHSHNGFDSTKIDYSRYELYDLVDEEELKIEVRKIVNSGSINPAGGVVIGDGSSGQPPVVLDADVPDAVTGTRAVTGLNGDNTTFVDAHWDPSDKAKEYVVQLHRSEDSGSNYTTVSQVTVDGLSHRFDGIVNIGLISTIRYKIVVYARSNTGVIGGTGEISNVSPALDTGAPAIPSFTTSETNMRLGIRGFMALVQENTEVDMKRGIGQYEWELASNTGFSAIVKTVRASSQIFNANGLTTGAAYYLRVKAIDSSDNASGWRYWNGTGNAGATSGPGASITPAQIEGSAPGYEAEIAAGSITTADIKVGSIDADLLDADLIFVGHTIQSDPYSAGSTGWKIDKAGTGEFNSTLTMKNLVVTGLGGGGINVGSNAFIVTDAGAITATSGTVGGWTIGSTLSATNILLDPSTPKITLGSKTTLTDSNTGLYLGTDGIALGASSVFKVTSAGALTSTSGTIGGWTIGASSISLAGTGTTGGKPGTMTLKQSGISSGLWVSTVDSTLDGYIVINQGADVGDGIHSNLQILAPRMNAGSTRPGMTIKHYADGNSSINIGLPAGGSPQINIGDTTGSDVISMTNANVGIGIATPKAKLHTVGGLAIGPGGAINSTDGARNSIQIATDTAYGGNHDNHSGFRIHSQLNATWGDASLHFAGATDWETYGNEVMVLRGTRVGIGTDSPAQVLDVVGNIAVTGTVTATTFSGALSGNASSATNATNATYIGVAANAASSNRYLLFATATSGDLQPLAAATLAYNPGTNYLYCGNFDASGSTTLGPTSLDGHFTMTGGGTTQILWDESSTNDVFKLYQNGASLQFEYSANNGSSYVDVMDMYSNRVDWHVKFIVKGDVYPWTDNLYNSGTTTFGGYLAWDNVYAHDLTDVSDGNFKDVTGTPPGIDFVNRLTPVSYNWKDKVRTHWGFISQDVRDAVSSHGFDASDIAIWTDSRMTPADESVHPEELEEGSLPRYGLRYTELIAPLVKAVQELSTKLDAAEARIVVLES